MSENDRDMYGDVPAFEAYWCALQTGGRSFWDAASLAERAVALRMADDVVAAIYDRD